MGNPKIAVVGAGPAGCMLARLLHLGGVDVTVFEGEESTDFRGQGGSLDLHTDTGLAAVKEAKLWDEFQQHARYAGQYLALVDKDLHIFFERGAEQKMAVLGERPEIDRSKLREMLVNCLPDGMIQWGHHLQRVDDGTLIFKDGSSASGFDLIVGAEGAWSKVRNFIAPGLHPVYIGVAMHELFIPDAENTTPELCKIVNQGSVFGSAEGQRLSIQNMGDGSLYVGAVFTRKDEDWTNPEKCCYDVNNHEEVKKALLEEFKDWCPELRDAIQHSQRSRPRSLHILPVGGTWQHKAGYTLIGDAAHLMTPFAGQGVNQALSDAMVLARKILQDVKDGKDINDGIANFEQDMVNRVKKIQQLAYDLTQDWMFTPHGGKTSISKALTRHANADLPAIAHPLTAAAMHSYMFYKSLTMKK